MGELTIAESSWITEEERMEAISEEFATLKERVKLGTEVDLLLADHCRVLEEILSEYSQLHELTLMESKRKQAKLDKLREDLVSAGHDVDSIDQMMSAAGVDDLGAEGGASGGGRDGNSEAEEAGDPKRSALELAMEEERQRADTLAWIADAEMRTAEVSAELERFRGQVEAADAERAKQDAAIIALLGMIGPDMPRPAELAIAQVDLEAAKRESSEHAAEVGRLEAEEAALAEELKGFQPAMESRPPPSAAARPSSSSSSMPASPAHHLQVLPLHDLGNLCRVMHSAYTVASGLIVALQRKKAAFENEVVATLTLQRVLNGMLASSGGHRRASVDLSQVGGKKVGARGSLLAAPRVASRRSSISDRIRPAARGSRGASGLSMPSIPEEPEEEDDALTGAEPVVESGGGGSRDYVGRGETAPAAEASADDNHAANAADPPPPVPEMEPPERERRAEMRVIVTPAQEDESYGAVAEVDDGDDHIFSLLGGTSSAAGGPSGQRAAPSSDQPLAPSAPSQGSVTSGPPGPAPPLRLSSSGSTSGLALMVGSEAAPPPDLDSRPPSRLTHNVSMTVLEQLQAVAQRNLSDPDAYRDPTPIGVGSPRKVVPASPAPAPAPAPGRGPGPGPGLSSLDDFLLDGLDGLDGLEDPTETSRDKRDLPRGGERVESILAEQIAGKKERKILVDQIQRIADMNHACKENVAELLRRIAGRQGELRNVEKDVARLWGEAGRSAPLILPTLMDGESEVRTLRVAVDELGREAAEALEMATLWMKLTGNFATARDVLDGRKLIISALGNASSRSSIPRMVDELALPDLREAHGKLDETGSQLQRAERTLSSLSSLVDQLITSSARLRARLLESLHREQDETKSRVSVAIAEAEEFWKTITADLENGLKEAGMLQESVEAGVTSLTLFRDGDKAVEAVKKVLRERVSTRKAIRKELDALLERISASREAIYDDDPERAVQLLQEQQQQQKQLQHQLQQQQFHSLFSSSNWDGSVGLTGSGSAPLTLTFPPLHLPSAGGYFASGSGGGGAPTAVSGLRASAAAEAALARREKSDDGAGGDGDAGTSPGLPPLGPPALQAAARSAPPQVAVTLELLEARLLRLRKVQLLSRKARELLSRLLIYLRTELGVISGFREARTRGGAGENVAAAAAAAAVAPGADLWSGDSRKMLDKYRAERERLRNDRNDFQAFFETEGMIQHGVLLSALASHQRFQKLMAGREATLRQQSHRYMVAVRNLSEQTRRAQFFETFQTVIPSYVHSVEELEVAASVKSYRSQVATIDSLLKVTIPMLAGEYLEEGVAAGLEPEVVLGEVSIPVEEEAAVLDPVRIETLHSRVVELRAHYGESISLSLSLSEYVDILRRMIEMASRSLSTAAALASNKIAERERVLRAISDAVFAEDETLRTTMNSVRSAMMDSAALFKNAGETLASARRVALTNPAPVDITAAEQRSERLTAQLHAATVEFGELLTDPSRRARLNLGPLIPPGAVVHGDRQRRVIEDLRLAVADAIETAEWDEALAEEAIERFQVLSDSVASLEEHVLEVIKEGELLPDQAASTLAAATQLLAVRKAQFGLASAVLDARIEENAARKQHISRLVDLNSTIQAEVERTAAISSRVEHAVRTRAAEVAAQERAAAAAAAAAAEREQAEREGELSDRASRDLREKLASVAHPLLPSHLLSVDSMGEVFDTDPITTLVLARQEREASDAAALAATATAKRLDKSGAMPRPKPLQPLGSLASGGGLASPASARGSGLVSPIVLADAGVVNEEPEWAKQERLNFLKMDQNRLSFEQMWEVQQQSKEAVREIVNFILAETYDQANLRALAMSERSADAGVGDAPAGSAAAEAPVGGPVTAVPESVQRYLHAPAPAHPPSSASPARPSRRSKTAASASPLVRHQLHPEDDLSVAAEPADPDAALYNNPPGSAPPAAEDGHPAKPSAEDRPAAAEGEPPIDEVSRAAAFSDEPWHERRRQLGLGEFGDLMSPRQRRVKLMQSHPDDLVKRGSPLAAFMRHKANLSAPMMVPSPGLRRVEVPAANITEIVGKRAAVPRLPAVPSAAAAAAATTTRPATAPVPAAAGRQVGLPGPTLAAPRSSVSAREWSHPAAAALQVPEENPWPGRQYKEERRNLLAAALGTPSSLARGEEQELPSQAQFELNSPYAKLAGRRDRVSHSDCCLRDGLDPVLGPPPASQLRTSGAGPIGRARRLVPPPEPEPAPVPYWLDPRVRAESDAIVELIKEVWDRLDAPAHVRDSLLLNTERRYDLAHLSATLRTLLRVADQASLLTKIILQREACLASTRQAMWNAAKATGPTSILTDRTVRSLVGDLRTLTQDVEAGTRAIRGQLPWISVLRVDGRDYMEKMVEDTKTLAELKDGILKRAPPDSSVLIVH